MSGLEIFFQNPDECAHPKIRSWLKVVQEGKGKLSCEIQRKREGLGFRRPKIYLHSEMPGGFIITDEDDWDAELNRFLLKRKVRAVSAENEQIRFALMLKDFLKKPETRFGDGYFNAVLLELVTTAFQESADVQKKVKQIAPSTPNKGRVYADCVSMIEGAIGSCAMSLVNDLGYQRSEAEKLLAGAMGNYLDERFSLTSRQLLGLG